MKDINIFFTNNRGTVLFVEIPDSPPEVNASIISRIENWLFDKRDYQSYFKTIGTIHYARLRDYSWWTLRNNMRLAVNVTLKAISIPAFEDSKVYDVETPYLKGYLRNGRTKENHLFLIFDFKGRGKRAACLFSPLMRGQ